MIDDYVPINCDFHDVLEDRAVRRHVVTLRYLDEEQRPATVRSRILDVYASGSVEFIRIEQGPPVRLDRILSVDGLEASGFTDAADPVPGHAPPRPPKG